MKRGARRGAVHEKETLVRGPLGFESDKLLPDGPLERLHHMLAREYQKEVDADYSCISWAMQVKAHDFATSVDFDVLAVMLEIERLNPQAFSEES